MTLLKYNQKTHWDSIALRYMSDSSRILDVACGQGRFISNDPKRITGVDGDKQSTEFCKGKGFNVVQGKVTELPFENSSFDAVHASHVIEHLFPEDAHKMLSEMDRVLSRGGVLCIRTPLMHKGFFNSFTHTRPYPPEAILNYLNPKDQKRGQRTLSDIPGSYSLLFLKYRRSQFFSSTKKLYGLKYILWKFFRILYRLYIRSPKPTGYMIILKKDK